MNSKNQEKNKIELLKKIWPIYENAFPPNERRCKADHERLSLNQNYHIRPYYKGDKLIGFVCYWELDEVLFIEHMAVDEAQRGIGHGKKLLADIIALHRGMIILEVEYPKDEITQNRIKFYRSMGFQLNKLEYMQPSYGTGKEEVPLLLMSFPDLISPTHGIDLINQIQRVVYLKE